MIAPIVAVCFNAINSMRNTRWDSLRQMAEEKFQRYQ